MVLSILIVRILRIIVPEMDITFFDTIIYHFWLGVILMLIGLVISKQEYYLKILLYGIGT